MFQSLQRAAACLGILALATTSAQAGPALAEAVAAAYERHPERTLAGAERDLADAIQQRARAPFAGDPAFNLRHDNDALGSDDGYREWEGGVTLPLWWPGQQDQRLAEAAQTRAGAVAMAAATRLEVAGVVRERLWDVALARGNHAEAELALAGARDLEHDIERRVAAGELPASDLLLARQETLAREDALQQAASRVTQAERLFSRYTGLAEAPAAAAEALPQAAEPRPRHPALALAEVAVDKARAHRDRVAGERRGNPSLWLGGKRSRDMSGADYQSAVALEVTIPLGMEAAAAPDLAAAEAALTEALAGRDRTRRELAEALEQARLELDRARRAVARAEERLALANEGLRLARRAFDLGEADLVRLLRARGEAVGARHALELRRLEVGQASARLNQALGVIPQ